MDAFFDKISYHRMHKNIFVLIISENLICRWSNIISDIQQTSRTHEPFCREPRGWGCYPRCPGRRSPPWPRRRSRTSASGEIYIAGEYCDDDLLTMYSSSSYSWKHSEEELFIATKLSFQFNLSIILDLGPQNSFFNTSILDCLRKQLKDSEGYICLYFWK